MTTERSRDKLFASGEWEVRVNVLHGNRIEMDAQHIEMTSYSLPDRSQIICTSLMWHFRVNILDGNRIEMDDKHIEMNCGYGKL